MRINEFSDAILHWFHLHGRKSLPWQVKRTPYRVWVSEIMLQQTQVATVIPYFEKFMQRFPDIIALADAEADQVMYYWSGLGYYARARNLHKAAQIVRDQYLGKFPENIEQVMSLPGVGRSTAGAILSLACDQPHAILDGNVKRVLARYFMIEGWYGKTSVLNQLWQKAIQLTPTENIASYNQAMMDIGSLVCTRSKPVCEECPVNKGCQAFKENKQSEFPTPKPKKNIPVKSVRMAMLRNTDSALLLQRRPPAGIWGGLLSFPEIPDDARVDQWCADTLGLKVSDQQLWPVVRHTFSHFHLDITPVLISVNQKNPRIMDRDHWVWYKGSSVEIGGLAAPVKRLISELESGERGS
ncbi:A/G-specific adenine glycosylase [Kaarinaea lacus]